jgi:hypothetical protein
MQTKPRSSRVSMLLTVHHAAMHMAVVMQVHRAQRALGAGSTELIDRDVGAA